MATKPKSAGMSTRASTRVLMTPSVRVNMRNATSQPAPTAVRRLSEARAGSGAPTFGWPESGGLSATSGASAIVF